MDQSSDATDMIIMIYKIRIYVIMIKVRRQRELLSRLEEEMELVRDQREEVRRDKGRVFLFIWGIQVKTKLEKERRRSKEAEVKIEFFVNS